MAQLTLSERSSMANNSIFQQRLSSAVKKTANYWKDYTLSTVADFNKANQKRKIFSRNILNSVNYVNIQAYAEYLLTQYNTESPVIISDVNNIANTQLQDSELTDSGASSSAFDFFSGVVVGDSTEIIDF